MVYPYLILCSPGTDQIPTAINEDYPEKPANSGQIIMRIAIISDYILGFSHRHTSLTIIIIYIYIHIVPPFFFGIPIPLGRTPIAIVWQKHPPASSSQWLHCMPSVARMQQRRSNGMVLVGNHAALRHQGGSKVEAVVWNKCRE